MQIIMEKTFDMDGINRIVVNTSSADVELIQTEEVILKAQVWAGEMDEQNPPVELEMNKKGESLEVRILRNRQGWLSRIKSLSFSGVKVVFELPTRLYDQIIVSGQSSDLSARELLANKISLSCHSGDIELEACVAKQELNSETTSGDVKIQGALVKGKMTAHAASGEITLNQLTSEELMIRTHSGDINVSDYRGSLNAQASSGDIELRNDKLAGDLTIESSSGDVRVSFQEEPDSFTLDYHGSSGDGDVQVKGLLYEEKSEHRIVGKKEDGKYRVKVRTSSGDFVLR